MQAATGTGTETKCTPKQHQIKYYNELNANAANSFDGNVLYFALKAMEDNNNRTEPAITEEDHARIANISDHSRFIPAGMETANKAICAKILQEMDEVSGLFSTTALCAWDYICDYRADRFPNYLFKARCKTSRCNGSCSTHSNKHTICQSHGIHVTVLEMTKNCKEWVWGQELLPLACTCTNEVIMKAESMLG